MKHETRFLILLAGDLIVDDHIKTLCQTARIIAADGGIKHAKALDVIPELWLGDFDSATPDLINRWGHVKRANFERNKNLTDGSLAIKAALEKGAKTIILAGAMGGRLDHTIGLMMEMMALDKSGIDVFMTSGLEQGWPLHHGDYEFEFPKHSIFSILPLTHLAGLSIKGGRYLLDQADISYGSTRTLSNIVDHKIRISLQSGEAVLIARPYDLSGF